MYSRLSDAISATGSGILMAAMSPGDAKKELEKLKDDPGLAKQLFDELAKRKPGQKPLTAGEVMAMSPMLKTFMIALMTLAPAAFADEDGLSDLKMMLKNPSNISVEKVNTIQEKSEDSMAKKQLEDMKALAKSTKPGAETPTPQAFNLKGIKITLNSQGQASLAQKAVKMLNELGSSGASAETIKGQAQAFAKMIQGLHS